VEKKKKEASEMADILLWHIQGYFPRAKLMKQIHSSRKKVLKVIFTYSALPNLANPPTTML
jgi:hypothetical protein